MNLLKAAVSIAAALGGSGCLAISGADLNNYVERETKTFQVSTIPEVTVTTFDGAIEIRPWDRSDVQVVVEKRGRDERHVAAIEVSATQSGSRVEVTVRHPKVHGFHFQTPSANLIVSVPARADVSARSGDGSIDVERITGHIQLRSGDGSIRARSIGGDLDVHTGDGSVAVSGALTRVRAQSGDGSVKVHANAGSAPSSDWDIVTGDGSVTLEVADGFNAEVDARTGDGGIRMHDLTLSNVTGTIERRALKGRLGAGGPTVRVRTGDGSITLAKVMN